MVEKLRTNQNKIMESVVVSSDAVVRKEGESDEDYQKRVDEHDQSVRDFWTKENMQNAKPMEMPNPDDKKKQKK